MTHFHIALGDLPTWVAAVGGLTGGWIALRQLRAQHAEIARQADEQARLATVQAQQTKLQARSQAEEVTVARMQLNVAFHGIQADNFETVVVTNGSRRPVRNLRARFRRDGAWTAAKGALSHMGINGEVAEQHEGYEYLPIRLLVGSAAKFIVFAVPYETGHREFEIRFEDDADNHWQIDQDMRLIELPDDTW